MKTPVKKVTRVVLFLGYLLALYVGFLYFFQYDLLFWPSKDYRSPKDMGFTLFREVVMTAADGTPIMHWYHEGDKDKPAILFFHGNTGQIADFSPGLVPIARAGYSVLAMEYRNFGNTGGEISQKVVFQDAANAFDFLKKQGHKKVVAYGYSFGTAFASGLTSLRPVDGVILTAPFSSLYNIVSEKPVPLAKYLLKDNYPSVQYLQNYEKPLLIVHGTKDNVIPYHHGQMLYNNAKSNDKSIHLLDNTDHITVFWRFKNLPFILPFLEKLSR